MRRWVRWLAVASALTAGFLIYRRLAVPAYRTDLQSELIMLGDLDGDHRWDEGDGAQVRAFLADPFAFDSAFARRLDLNQNGLLDPEDLAILERLVAEPDPYRAEAAASQAGNPFPRPREPYHYQSIQAFQPRPRWALPFPHPVPELPWLMALRPPSTLATYADLLEADLYQEAVRFAEAYRKREPGLRPAERAYAAAKLKALQATLESGPRHQALLDLMALVEDAETLRSGPAEARGERLLRFRDHLREALASAEFEAFRNGQGDAGPVLARIEAALKTDLDLTRRLETLPPPRDLTHLQNYLQRAEWQYYKTSTRESDFRQLVAYAQHDPRYLRAVARTSRVHADLLTENHNLPMQLLFREALRIKGGDKKRAVGLLDEAIRIPFGWIKTIPREKLPRSLAVDNFLLPGNKEDGHDKSRHWNVFGGICLYKSPEEALELALQREWKDFKEGGRTPEALTEFLRDMIANLNGMYYVTAADPDLRP